MALRRLALGGCLILLASGVLLLSDAGHRGAADGKGKKKWKLAVVCYSDSPLSEEATRGTKDGLAKAGMVEGRDFSLKISNAQGDVATLNNIMAGAMSEGVDMVLPISTPSLQAALRQFDKTPVVFSTVSSGVLAGAGKTEADHRANVTGITTLSAFSEMADVLKECLPHVRRVGTLFTPSEINSVHHKEMLEDTLRGKGIELLAVPASTASEVADAAISLGNQQIDAVCQISDNLSSAAFSSIAVQADKARLPVFSFVSSQPRHGGLVAVARDYYDAGFEAAQVAVRIMRGEDPARIPFANVKTVRLVVNLQVAQKLGIQLPASLVSRADEVIR